jgi:DNA (cytosine-5)-methyltransferase 1
MLIGGSESRVDNRPTYYEFFAGGGMARAGLGEGWRCLFANDFDRKKAESYRDNWGGDELYIGDVRELSTVQLPGRADLVWASFPCQDLSLAGAGAGLKGERSGTFWPFWDLMKALRQEGRAPSIIVLENVCGALTSHGGKDFTKICDALAKEGYRFGALVIDAALFVPQSRPRLFIVAAREDVVVPSSLLRHCERSEAIQSRKGGSGLLRRDAPRKEGQFQTSALVAAHERLPKPLRANWLWWNMPAPPLRNATLIDIIEDAPTDVAWHGVKETNALIAMMSDVNLAKIAEAKRAGRKMVGTLYRRTRYQNGAIRQCRRLSAHAGRRLEPAIRARRRQGQSPFAADVGARDRKVDGAAGHICVAGELQRSLPPDRGWRRRSGRAAYRGASAGAADRRNVAS